MAMQSPFTGNTDYHVVAVIGSGMLGIRQNIQAEFHDELKKNKTSPCRKRSLDYLGSPVTVTGRNNTNIQLKFFSWEKVKNDCLRNDITLENLLVIF